MYFDGGVVQSHRPEFQWLHVRTNLVSVVNLTPCPPQEPTPLRFAVRLRIPKPMLPSPALG